MNIRTSFSPSCQKFLNSAGRVGHPGVLGVGAVFVLLLATEGCHSGGDNDGNGHMGGAQNADGGSSADGGQTSTGGAATGGGGGHQFETDFMLGVDISSVPEELDRGTVYFDTDGVARPILKILENHGFNYVRLRTFVDPMAPYGYASGDGGSCLKSDSYCDLAHTLEFGRLIKEAGMGLMVDFHYSDNWADPGKQLIPEAWRDAETIEELAGMLKAYTSDAISVLIEGGARPDIVQIGNEITPGMLIHVPTPETDCWGNNSVRNELNGSTANWDNLATLLRAGLEAVEELDPSIQTLIHLENTEDPTGAVRWVQTAHEHEVAFDILGMSCYPAYQGPPSVWKETFQLLAETFPDLSFVVAEYGPEPQAVLDTLKGIPDGRGKGAFRWEPTQSGTWGPGMFTRSAQGYYADEEEFAVYDALNQQSAP